MELFRIFGTIAVSSADAIESIEKTINEAKKADKSVGGSFIRIGNKSKELGKKLAGFSAVAGAAFAASVHYASDLEESQNKVDVAFGKSSKSVKKWAGTTIKQYGIAKGTALDMAATFGDMGTSMGLTNKEAAGMSTNLVGLAGDLASFKNIGIDRASTALNGIFTGETESLKGLGIVMTQTNLDAFALSNGFGKTTAEMTEAEKVQLRYAYVMDKTKNAQGDFARTNGGTANQLRMFQESLKELAATFGEQVLPYVAKGVQFLNNLLQKFSGLSDGSKKLVMGIVAFVAILSPLLIIFGQLCTSIGTVINLFKLLNLTFLTNPAFLVVAGIVALVAAFVILWKKSEKFRNFWIGLWSSIKATCSAAVKKIKTDWDNLKKKIASLGTSIKTALTKPFETARDKIKAIVEKIKAFFKFKVSAPHIPLPHFSIKPSGWKIGDLVKGKIPSLGVKWYAKGGIFDKPTIFNTASGLKGVGEAGAEAVAPISKLQEYVSAAVADQNAMLLEGLREIMAQQVHTFNIATQVDGKQIAIATAKYTQDQLNKLQTRNNRLVGVR